MSKAKKTRTTDVDKNLGGITDAELVLREKMKMAAEGTEAGMPCLQGTDKVSGVLFGQTAGLSPEAVFDKMQEVIDRGAAGLTVNVGSDAGGTPCKVTLCCCYNVEKNVPLKLTGYDKAVFGAVCSLLMAGHRAFSVRQVLEVMRGRPMHENYGAAALKDVERSIDKMRCMTVSFDWLDQAAMMGADTEGKKRNSFIFNENLLLLDKGEVTFPNGTSATGYSTIRVPRLYAYSYAIGQVTSISPECLAVPGIQTSQKNVAVIFYVAQRIMQMKNQKQKRSKTLTNVMRFETIFKHCEIEAKTRKITKRYRDIVFHILDYYVEIKFIKDYQPIMEGKSIAKVEIIT